MHRGNNSNYRKLLLGRKWGEISENGTLDTSRWDAFEKRMIDEGILTKKDYDLTKLTYLVRLDEMTRLLVTRKSGPKNWQEIVAASKSGPIKWGLPAYGREIHIMSILANACP